MKIIIEKEKRKLTLWTETNQPVLAFPIALGSCPTGPKCREGDGKTPEGEYLICLKKMGKYGPSLGISYPNEQDALRAGADDALIQCIRERTAQGLRPPWGSPLGGEIYIHGGGVHRDWTAGCIALQDCDALALYNLLQPGDQVEILP